MFKHDPKTLFYLAFDTLKRNAYIVTNKEFRKIYKANPNPNAFRTIEKMINITGFRDNSTEYYPIQNLTNLKQINKYAVGTIVKFSPP